MGTDAVELDEALIRFTQRLQRDMPMSRVLLFGSRAQGRARIDSDYDLIVVSSAFESVEHFSRSAGLRRLWRDVGGRGPLDLLCVSPQEMCVARMRPTLLAEVLLEAVEILGTGGGCPES